MMSELNLLLYRDIKDGKRFEKLIPESACESTYLGKGMTDFSVTNMADWVKQYAWQMQEVAPLMKGATLSQTCGNIHAFAYDHFQYKADLEDQYLRSPACSWHVRYDGIDCKSYSIIASCILVNLGISHYIRRVKQPSFNPDLWSHVYVIVPHDQKAFDLGAGYYVIDGTVPHDNETIYTQKSDLFMSGMKHYGLNAAYDTGLNASIGDTLTKIKSIFGGDWDLSCIGGTWDSKDVNATINSAVPWFDNMLTQINAAVASNSPTVMTLINKLLTNAQLFAQQGVRIGGTSMSSTCSKKAAKAYKELSAHYNNIVQQAFLAWVETYFTVTYKSLGPVAINTFEFATPGFGKATATMTGIKNLASLQLKTGISTIYKFELTPYALDKNTYKTSVNVGTLLTGMQTVLASFETKTSTDSNNNSNTNNSSNNNSGSNSSGTNNSNDSSTGSTKDVNAGKTPQTAGMGVTGWLIIGVAAGSIVKMIIDSNSASKSTKKSA